MMEDIELWRDAPLWDPQSIAVATKTWFQYLGTGGLRSWNRWQPLQAQDQDRGGNRGRSSASRRARSKVIMCHGVFDVVHPGHVRHLLYAKSKADVLVASLTADRHILKANYRPYVPQELRAINLAAFEIVDYVVIDPEPTPLENIGADQARLSSPRATSIRRAACR